MDKQSIKKIQLILNALKKKRVMLEDKIENIKKTFSFVLAAKTKNEVVKQYDIVQKIEELLDTIKLLLKNTTTLPTSLKKQLEKEIILLEADRDNALAVLQQVTQKTIPSELKKMGNRLLSTLKNNLIVKGVLSTEIHTSVTDNQVIYGYYILINRLKDSQQKPTHLYVALTAAVWKRSGEFEPIYRVAIFKDFLAPNVVYSYKGKTGTKLKDLYHIVQRDTVILNMPIFNQENISVNKGVFKKSRIRNLYKSITIDGNRLIIETLRDFVVDDKGKPVRKMEMEIFKDVKEATDANKRGFEANLHYKYILKKDRVIWIFNYLPGLKKSTEELVKQERIKLIKEMRRRKEREYSPQDLNELPSYDYAHEFS